MDQRSCFVKCHYTCFPLFLLAILGLTSVGFYFEIEFYEKRQDVLDAYQGFYGVQLPKMNTLCTASTKELNEAINSVRLNFSEKDFLLIKAVEDPEKVQFNNFNNLRFMDADD